MPSSKIKFLTKRVIYLWYFRKKNLLTFSVHCFYIANCKGCTWIVTKFLWISWGPSCSLRQIRFGVELNIKIVIFSLIYSLQTARNCCIQSKSQSQHMAIMFRRGLLQSKYSPNISAANFLLANCKAALQKNAFCNLL